MNATRRIETVTAQRRPVWEWAVFAYVGSREVFHEEQLYTPRAVEAARRRAQEALDRV